ncbi:hypothetical protein TRAPUB_2652 [Trametes pubescens]|uniref:F-box domain-containing protein n=1 Tax=Trametes pubescens TaxID=154538 RepID=A0A1M2VG36_TRAPU|nr:hypothetical protein TRAPUB_2652 [Trametes pubescens]
MSTSEVIASPTWIYLERLSSGKPLLPSLRQLRWFLTSAWSTELLLLATPALDHLTVDYAQSFPEDDSEWESGINALFRHVFALSTRITQLILHTRRLDFARHVPLLSTLVQLRVLKLYQWDDGGGIHAEQLQVLSRLPELNTLRIVLDMYDDPIPVFHGFERLRKLIIVDTIGSVQKLFATCNLHSLRELDLTHTVYGAHDDWIVASEAVAANLRNLARCNWKICPTDPDELSTTAEVLTRMLTPLASLRYLQYVAVTVEVACADGGVSDTLLRTLAEAWPRLRKLALL